MPWPAPVSPPRRHSCPAPRTTKCPLADARNTATSKRAMEFLWERLRVGCSFRDWLPPACLVDLILNAMINLPKGRSFALRAAHRLRSFYLSARTRETRKPTKLQRYPGMK